VVSNGLWFRKTEEHYITKVTKWLQFIGWGL